MCEVKGPSKRLSLNLTPAHGNLYGHERETVEKLYNLILLGIGYKYRMEIDIDIDIG
jgi:hypothetical protein